MDIVFGLIGLFNFNLVEKMLDFCFEFWLSFCYFFVENGKEKFDMVVKNLLFLD